MRAMGIAGVNSEQVRAVTWELEFSSQLMKT